MRSRAAENTIQPRPPIATVAETITRPSLKLGAATPGKANRIDLIGLSTTVAIAITSRPCCPVRTRSDNRAKKGTTN